MLLLLDRLLRSGRLLPLVLLLLLDLLLLLLVLGCSLMLGMRLLTRRLRRLLRRRDAEPDLHRRAARQAELRVRHVRWPCVYARDTVRTAN